jgi:hypothetical protein
MIESLPNPERFTAWMQTGLLLDKWFADLPHDAKKFIVDRLCTTLTEFGGDAVAQRLKHAHGMPAPTARPVPSEHNGHPTYGR